MKVNIYCYTYNDTKDVEIENIKTLEVPNDLVNAIDSKYHDYVSFLGSLKTLKDRTKNSDEIKKLLYEYKEAEYRLEEFIFNATFLLPINKDTISGYCGVENAETEEIILEY